MLVDNNTGRRRKPTTWQIVHSVTPVIVIAMLSWLALQFVDFKVAIKSLDMSVAAIQKDLLDHNLETKETVKNNSRLHHREMGVAPCNGCHKR